MIKTTIKYPFGNGKHTTYNNGDLGDREFLALGKKEIHENAKEITRSHVQLKHKTITITMYTEKT